MGGLAACCAFAWQSKEEHVSERKLKVGELERSYLVHVPPSYSKDKPAALVFVFHGGGGQAKQMIRFTGMAALSDQEGFIAVFPDAVDGNWNDGRNADSIPSQRDKIDDVGFVAAMIDALSKEFKIDPKRVYATGISNGGFISERLGAQLSDRFAAIAPVASGMAPWIAENFAPKEPVSVLILNGTEDPLVPYHGGPVVRDRGKTIDTDEIVKKWAAHNQCSDKPEVDDLPDRDPNDGTRIKRSTWTKGKNATEVVLYSIQGGGHTWPGGTQYLPERVVGRVCRDIEAEKIIWEFFAKHPKP